LSAIAQFGPVGLEAEQLVYSDITNKVIGPLSGVPIDEEDLSLFIITGIIQKYTQDYTVRQVSGGAFPGYYVCISTTSTAPGSGSFAGGSSNPATGIDGLLAFGDTARVIYPI
jgi:hypothetical protein